MKKRNLKPMIISALTAVAMGSIGVGTTFALFTDKAETSISVQAGLVEIANTVEITEAKSLYDTPETVTGGVSATYVNGGTAAVNNVTHKVEIKKWTPGDEITLRTNPDNNSNVKTLMRLRIVAEGELAPALIIKGKKSTVTDYEFAIKGNKNIATSWEAIDFDKNPTAYDLNISFPNTDNEIRDKDDKEGDNKYQEKSASITIYYEAVQGNAHIDDLLDRVNFKLATEEIIDNGANPTMSDAFEDLGDLLTPAKALEKSFVWSQELDQFAYKSSVTSDKYKYFEVCNELPVVADQTFSIFANGWTGVTSVALNGVGFDAANVSGIETISYTNTTGEAHNVVIRTNGGTLTVNAPADTVRHYGEANSVNIVAVASSSYHENGTVPFLQISKGRIELEAQAEVNGIHVANVQTVGENGEITKTANTFSNDVVLTLNGNDVKLTRDTIGTEIAAPVLVCEVQANANSDEYIWLVGDGTIENAKVYVTETKTTPNTSVASTTTKENASDAAIAIANNATNTGTEENPVYEAVEAGTSAEDAQVVSALEGTGTQDDPFLIYDYKTMQCVTTISSLYINDYDIVNYYYYLKDGESYVCDTWQDAIDMAKENGYSLSHLNDSPFYFKVKDGTKIIDCNEDNQSWVSVKLYGNFDGNGVTFTNLDSPLFSKAYSQSSTIGNFTADCNIVSQTGRAAICSNSAFNTLFHDITIKGYIEGQGQTAAVVSYPGSGVTEFKNVNVSADIVSLGDAGAAAFVINPYKLLSGYGGNSNSKLIFDDCHFSGKMSATGNCKFFYVHTVTVPVEIKNIDSSEYGAAVNTNNHYALASQSSKIAKSTIDISDVAAGDTFVFEKLDASAVTCTVTISISPNGTDEKGSFTGVYLRDRNIALGEDGKFHTSNAVKLTSATVNDNSKSAGLNDLDNDGKFENYNIISSVYGTTHNGGSLAVIQYDSRGNVVAYASATLFSKNN